MTESRKNNLVTKLCLPLLAVSFVIFLDDFFNHEAITLEHWSAMASILLGSVYFYAYAVQKTEASSQSLIENLRANSRTKAELQYYLHLIEPKSALTSKLRLAIQILSEFFPNFTLALYSCEGNAIKFVTAAKRATTNKVESLSQEDPLVSEISSKIFSVTDCESIKKTGGFAKPLYFSNGDKINGQIYSIDFYSSVFGILAAIGEDKLSESDSETLEDFCKGLALIVEDSEPVSRNQLFSPSNQPEKTNSESHQDFLVKLYESMQPPVISSLNHWEIAKYFVPSANRADFLDVIDASNDSKMILFGKCSGQGLSAADYVGKLKLMASCFIADCPTPAKLLNKLSSRLNDELMPDNFVDMLALKLIAAERQVTIAIAGDNIPIINRTRSGFAEIPQLDTAVPLGLFNQGTEPYKDQIIKLMPGDGLLLYTDGITDFPAKGLERISDEQIKNILADLPEQGAKDMLNSLVRQITRNNMGKTSFEDHSLIYLKAE